MQHCRTLEKLCLAVWTGKCQIVQSLFNSEKPLNVQFLSKPYLNLWGLQIWAGHRSTNSYMSQSRNIKIMTFDVSVPPLPMLTWTWILLTSLDECTCNGSGVKASQLFQMSDKVWSELGWRFWRPSTELRTSLYGWLWTAPQPRIASAQGYCQSATDLHLAMAGTWSC